MQHRSFIMIDGNSLIHRAFHALPPLSNADGVFTNAVFGFLNMMLKVVEEENPEYLAVAFDLHGPTFRHLDYSQYKAGRKPTAPELAPQFGLIRDCLTAMGVRQITCPSFEADDILGTLSRRCEEAGIPALIVTGDRDSMQLVSDTTNVLYTKRGVTEVVRYTPEQVRLDFGVSPAQITDLKGLMGDASDNIPGVPGIGEKTAVKLLGQYGTLEETLSHADADLKGKQREKLLDGAASGLMSKKLATINRYAPIDGVALEDCLRTSFAGGIPLLTQLGMKSVVGRIERLEHAKAAAPAPLPEWESETVLTGEADVRAWLCGRPGRAFALMLLETGFSVACDDRSRARIAFPQGLLDDGLDPQAAARLLSPLFTGEGRLLLYDAKRLMTQLSEWSVPFSAPFDDERIVQYLLSPQTSRYEAPADAAALTDAFTLDLAKLREQEMEPLYRNIELPLASTLFGMERKGFLVDREELVRLGRRYGEQIETLKSEIFSLCGTEPFNLNSPQQLGDVLFNQLGLPARKKTAKGFSTDADTLQELSNLHPAIDKILQYRQVSKLNSTYIDGLLRLTGRDGRIHTWFDQTTAATGRISSSEPNLQNIPVRTEMGREIRRAFIAEEGKLLVDADYSQIELRLLAHLSGDEAMCDAFLRGQDIHARTAAEVYGVPLEQVTHDMRSRSKAVNFGIVYGISDFGLASNLHISRKEAAEFIARYFERYPAIRRFMDESVASAKAQGYSVTLYGRRRPLPELSSPNYNRRQFGERAAMNTPVQGAAADIIKIAMNAVVRRLEQEGLEARLILQVHDELIVEAPPEEEKAVFAILKECMEGAASLRVPLVADIHSGRSWFETK